MFSQSAGPFFLLSPTICMLLYDLPKSPSFQFNYMTLKTVNKVMGNESMTAESNMIAENSSVLK